MKRLLTILIVLISLAGFGQETISEPVDNVPLFSGSDIKTHYSKARAYFKGCGLNLLPDRKNMIIGVSFHIDTIGVPSSPILLMGSDSTMFNTVVKCLNDSPRWIPATKSGKNVDCRYNLAFGK